MALGTALAYLAPHVYGMEFSPLIMGDGVTIIHGTGPIVPGDDDRLREALRYVNRTPEGLYGLALDSPGGSVDAAYQITHVMDEQGFITAVMSGESCASACASIVFVAGDYRLMSPGSRLGFHHCYYQSGQEVIADALCNEEVASHAVAHGVAWGSVMAWMQFTPPSDVLWFTSSEAACWGLLRYPGDPPGIQPAPCVIELIENYPQSTIQ